MEKISIIGLGYIGLPTAIVAAEFGFEVIGFDIDTERVVRINNGEAIIQEPDIIEKLSSVLKNHQFRASSILPESDCFIIAVPTPFKEEKKADLSYVWSAATMLSKVLKKGDVIIIESTVPVGTTDQVARFLEKKTNLIAGIDFFVAHCPERVLPGKIFYELIHNDRIIGGINQQSVEEAKQFYKKFVKGQLYLSNATTAEMVKLIENSSRDVAISFANQVAAMAYQIGLDPFEIIELANKHPRINILNPSCGVGGHCLAVDPWFLVESFPKQTRLIKAARMVNDDKPFMIVTLTRKCIRDWQKEHTGKPKVLALGLTYKQDIDDLRESPALFIAKKLAKYSDIEFMVCEPNVQNKEIQSVFDEALVPLEQGIAKADIIICLVKHRQFNKIKLDSLRHKKVLDFCGLFYRPRNVERDKQEEMFWPASSTRIIGTTSLAHTALVKEQSYVKENH